jgi:hypothetical protein
MRNPKWTFYVGVAFGIGLFILTLIAILSIPHPTTGTKPTAILKVTSFQPTATISDEGQTETATSEEGTAIPGVFAQNMQVRVSNTDGEGLKVHSEPDIESDTLTIAAEDSLWIIIDGPVISESRIWWKIQSQESEIEGWAVQDYLSAEYQ